MGDLKMVREIPAIVTVGKDTLIFTSGIVSIGLFIEENPELIVCLSNGDCHIFQNCEIAEFISQFPFNLFAKTPELAKLHAENSSLI